MRLSNRCGCFLALTGILFTNYAAAAIGTRSFSEKETLTQQLEAVHTSLSDVGQAINNDRVKLNTLEHSLQAVQKNIRIHSAEISIVTAEIKALKAEVNLSRKQQKQLTLQIAKHQKALMQHLSASYMPRSHSEIKLLLNQNSGAQLKRALGLYQYLQNAERQEILAAINGLKEASAIEQQAIQKETLLEKKQLELNQLSILLTSEKQKSETLISTLKTSISEKSLTHKALRERQHDLKNLLSDLSDEITKKSEEIAQEVSIIAQQGHLAWPASPAYSPNTPITLTKNQALLIKVMPNTPVKSVYAGKVIFADWLKGYGLLIIVDHGDNFMSLYGYNNQLLRHPGEQVLQGDTIAIVGDTDQSSNEDNLYFELRRHGETINPTQWLSERG